MNTALRDKYQFCIQIKGNGMLQEINITLRQLNAICIGWTILYLNDQLGKYKQRETFIFRLERAHFRPWSAGYGNISIGLG